MYDSALIFTKQYKFSTKNISLFFLIYCRYYCSFSSFSYNNFPKFIYLEQLIFLLSKLIKLFVKTIVIIFLKVHTKTLFVEKSALKQKHFIYRNLKNAKP